MNPVRGTKLVVYRDASITRLHTMLMQEDKVVAYDLR